MAFSISKLLLIYFVETEFSDEKLTELKYHNFNRLLDFHSANNTLSILSVLFVPFRFFSFLSHRKFFTPMATMIKIYYRMVASLLTYIVLFCLIILLFWTSALFFFLKPYCISFNSYQSALISVVMTNFWEDDDYEYMLAYSSSSFLFSFIIIMVNIGRYSILVLSIALSIYLYNKSAKLEKLDSGPSQEKILESIEEVKEGIEKLMIHKHGTNFENNYKKDELKLFEKKLGSHQNKKIVAWMLNRKKHLNENERQSFFKSLNPNLKNRADQMDFESEYDVPEDQKLINMQNKAANANKNHEKDGNKFENDLVDDWESKFIQPILFEFPFQLKSFLKSLFQLKPILISSYSVDKFRIVIENYVKDSNFTSKLLF